MCIMLYERWQGVTFVFICWSHKIAVQFICYNFIALYICISKGNVNANAICYPRGSLKLIDI